MFSIYIKSNEIENPKKGDVIQWGKVNVEILEVMMKGFFYVEGPESYKLRVRKK